MIGPGIAVGVSADEGRAYPGPLADAHLHLFRNGYHYSPWTAGDDAPDGSRDDTLGCGSEVEDYERERFRHGIVAGLVVGFQGPSAGTGAAIDPENNAYLRELAATRDWMTTLAYVPVGPTPSVGELVRDLDAGHAGVSLYLRDQADAEEVAGWPRTWWRRLADRQALISLNATPPAIAGCGDLVRDSPECAFLFAHLGLPGRSSGPVSEAELSDRMRPLLALATYGNCYVKISGLYAISDRPGGAYPHEVATPLIGAVLDAFGPARSLWGSDFSPSSDHLTFDQTVRLPQLDCLSATDRSQVLGGSLLRLLEEL